MDLFSLSIRKYQKAIQYLEILYLAFCDWQCQSDYKLKFSYFAFMNLKK